VRCEANQIDVCVYRREPEILLNTHHDAEQHPDDEIEGFERDVQYVVLLHF